MNRTRKLIQAFPQAPWRSQTQVVGLFLLFLVAVSIVAIFYLNVTAEATAVGREIQVMQATISAIEIENSALELDLGNLMSVDKLRDRARDLGFDPITPEEMEFIVVEGYFEDQPRGLVYDEQVPDSASQPEVLPDEYFELIFSWLLKNYYDNVFDLPEALR